MASWQTAQEAIRQAVALAVDAPDYAGADGSTQIQRCVWRNTRAAAGYRHPTANAATVELELGVVRTKGHDETRYELITEPPGAVEDQRLVPTYCGYRIATVTVSIETDSQEPGDAPVGQRASMLRVRLRRGACHALLQAAEVAVVDIQPTIVGDWLNADTGRRQAKAMTDIRFGFNEFYVDDTDGSSDWVATAQGDGELQPGDVAASFDTAE